MGKLVRDRIPQIIRAAGRDPDVRVLSDEEYGTALLDKLLEEAHELRAAQSSADRLDEAADVYEVLIGIATHLGVDIATIAEAAARKRTQRGAFTRTLVARDPINLGTLAPTVT